MRKVVLAVGMMLVMFNGVQARPGFDVSEIKLQDTISLNTLECVILVGPDLPQEDRIFTKLSEIYVGGSNVVHAENAEAFVKGCELDGLDELKRKAMQMRFGFALADIVVTVERAIEPRLYNNQCVRTIIKSLSLDFGNDIKLEIDPRMHLEEATGCN